MKINLDLNKIITTVILTIILYIGKTVHDLEINQKLIQYQMIQINKVLQDLYETKVDRLNK